MIAEYRPPGAPNLAIPSAAGLTGIDAAQERFNAACNLQDCVLFMSCSGPGEFSCSLLSDGLLEVKKPGYLFLQRPYFAIAKSGAGRAPSTPAPMAPMPIFAEPQGP